MATSVSFIRLYVWSSVCLLKVSNPVHKSRIAFFPCTSFISSIVSSSASNKFASLKSGKYSDAIDCATSFRLCVKSTCKVVFRSNVLNATQSFSFKW